MLSDAKASKEKEGDLISYKVVCAINSVCW